MKKNNLNLVFIFIIFILTILTFTCSPNIVNSGSTPSPWSDNSQNSTVATPAITPAGGVFTTPQNITITCSTNLAAIYYTTNGSDPTTSSNLYTVPINIASSLTLKARAFKTDFTESQIVSTTYTITGSCSSPTFSMPEATYDAVFNIIISTLTPGASIYYTTDGSDPSTDKTLYSSQITINKTTTVKAIAVNNNWADSAISTITYSLQVKSPTLGIPGGIYSTAQDVTIDCETSLATIYYTTDGNAPTTSSNIYSSAINIPLNSTMTIKAIAAKTGWTDSSIAINNYTITGKVATPSFTPIQGTYTSFQSITINCLTPGADIYYTTNGSDPSTSSTLFTAPIIINNTTTLKAKAFKTNWADSDVETAVYTITGTCATPTFTPGAGTYNSDQSVTINTSGPSGATIYYTTDGNDPTTSSSVYSSPILVDKNMIIKAITHKDTYADSPISNSIYAIQVTSPELSPAAGTYTTAQNITITCATSGADIHYTTDGTDPTSSSAAYTSAITVPLNTTMTIKAIADKTNLTDSSVTTGVYNVTGTVANPVLSPAGSTYTSTQNVTITTATTGAIIHYTTDGTDPTSSSAIYTGAINVPIETTMTIKAIAIKTDWINSNISSELYSVDAPPHISYSTPLNNASNVPVSSTHALTIVFDQNILKGLSGNITVYKSGGTQIDQIAVTSTNVSVSSNTAIITLNKSYLRSATTYYVQIDAGTFKDSTNNNFAGISDTTTWTFTTEDGYLVSESFESGLGTWTQLQPGPPNITYISTGGLTHTTYSPTAYGGYITLQNSNAGESRYKSFTNITSGVIYASFIVNKVTNTTSTSTGFGIALCDSSNNKIGGTYLKGNSQASGKRFDILRHDGTSLQTNINNNINHVVVIKYDFSTNKITLFYDPDVTSSETGGVTINSLTTPSDISSIIIDQRWNYAADTGDITYQSDEIRVTKFWSDLQYK